ncbi:hypothetical protein RvY_06829 [Ramazzottius varieornatus]|uniref:Transposase Helix-turn-helix domain-containing protein n=1 Tax=Ramazzottius varieornatus TaxID=947166 RepID=A0A1D1V658_RAMVA|nr:hypothetical protein RvY_06829 [Ramazzottius varieornatus]
MAYRSVSICLFSRVRWLSERTMDLPSNQALAINIAVTAASQRPPEADQRTVRTESQISAAAELICTVIRNCATASSLLSSLNRQLPLYKVRVLQRQAFWELYSDDDDLKKVFGVQRSTFAKLLRDLKPYLQPTRDSFFGRPEHPLELQVACSLYYLTKGTSYSTCIGVFGIGKSTAFKYVKRFVLAVKHAYPDVVKMPSAVQLDLMFHKTMKKFRWFAEVEGSVCVWGSGRLSRLLSSSGEQA